MLKNLLSNHKLYHSNYQMENFIISKNGGTLYGMWKQNLRELYKRSRGLRETYCDNEKLAIEIEQLEHQIKVEKDDFEKRLKEVELKRKIMLTEESERVLKDTEREFKKFYSQAVYLDGKMSEKHGELTEEVLHNLEIEFWEYQAKERIALDYATQGNMTKQTLELIQSMPQRKEIMSINPKQHYEDYMERELFDITQAPQLELNKEDILSLKS